MIKWILFILLPLSAYSQQSKSDYLSFISNNSKLDKSKIEQYEKIYFVRFDFCDGKKYCGKNNFYQLVDSSKMGNTLFIVDTSYQKVAPSYLDNKTVVFVDRTKLMRAGLFTPTTILITKKKR